MTKLKLAVEDTQTGFKETYVIRFEVSSDAVKAQNAIEWVVRKSMPQLKVISEVRAEE